MCNVGVCDKYRYTRAEYLTVHLISQQDSFGMGIEGRAADVPQNRLTDCYRILPLPQMVRTVLVRRWRATVTPVEMRLLRRLKRTHSLRPHGMILLPLRIDQHTQTPKQHLMVDLDQTLETRRKLPHEQPAIMDYDSELPARTVSSSELGSSSFRGGDGVTDLRLCRLVIRLYCSVLSAEA